MEIQLNHGTAFTLELFDKTIAVSQSIVIQWIVMAIIILALNDQKIDNHPNQRTNRNRDDS